MRVWTPCGEQWLLASLWGRCPRLKQVSTIWLIWRRRWTWITIPRHTLTSDKRWEQLLIQHLFCRAVDKFGGPYVVCSSKQSPGKSENFIKLAQWLWIKSNIKIEIIVTMLNWDQNTDGGDNAILSHQKPVLSNLAIFSRQHDASPKRNAWTASRDDFWHGLSFESYFDVLRVHQVGDCSRIGLFLKQMLSLKISIAVYSWLLCPVIWCFVYVSGNQLICTQIWHVNLRSPNQRQACQQHRRQSPLHLWRHDHDFHV